MANPALHFDPSTLARYGRLALVARQLVEGFLTGVHKSPYKGFSVEFAEHRQYSPGDEIRHIDWRVYGKTDRYYIKEFEEETNLRTYLLLDASGSMGYTGQHGSKLQYAQHVAASLAYLLLHQRDAVGLAAHDTRLRQMLPPRASARHLLFLLRALEETRPGGETALAPIWHQLAEKVRPRSLFVLLSDCFSPVAELLRALQHFRHRRHEVILFHILAPEEIEFPFQKWTQFRSLESAGQHLLVDPQRLRKHYRQRFEEFCQQLREAAGRAQADYHLLRTDAPVERALGAYLSSRQRQR